MSELLDSLRGLVRQELARRRSPALGLVTAVFSRQNASSDGNHQVSVRLRDGGVELPRVPVAVGRLGLSALPSVGDLVVVVFVDGALNAPIVVGAVYDEQSQPPIADPDQVVYQPQDAVGGERRLHLELPNGLTLTAQDDGVSVVAGGTEVRVDRDGDLSIKVSGSINLEAQGDIRIEASGSLDLLGQAGAKLSGATVLAEGQGEAKLKAPSVSLAGLTQFSAS